MITPQQWLRVSKIEPIPGDFIVERGGGVLSSLIAFRQGGIWGHVSIPVSTFAKIEMHWPGIRAATLNFRHQWAYLRLKPTNQRKVEPDRWKKRLEEHIERRIRYNTLGILGSLLNLPGITHPKREYCSSLLEDLLEFSSGLSITRSQFPWPDRCYESELYNVIGWSSKDGRQHAEFTAGTEDRRHVNAAIQ